MASGLEWREYFEKKSVSYLKKQIMLIRNTEKLDSKIISEFQLSYLDGVASIIEGVIHNKRSH